MSDTLRKVKTLTAEVLKLDVGEVSDNAHFVNDLGAESVQSIELVAAFEEGFDIELDEDAALSIASVGAATTFIDEVIARQK